MVAQVVLDHYGEVPWLKQCQDGVVAFVTMCVRQLGENPGPQANAQPLAAGAQYNQPARTAEEIKATPAANEGTVSRAPRQFRTEDPVETVDRRGELADPVQQPQQAPARRIILPSDPWAL